MTKEYNLPSERLPIQQHQILTAESVIEMTQDRLKKEKRKERQSFITEIVIKTPKMSDPLLLP